MDSLFITEIEKEYSELLNTGKIELIEEVKKATTKHFNYKHPIYFIGNIRSKLVLVNFNSAKSCYSEGGQPLDFHSYKSRYQNIGKLFYENLFEKVPKAKYLSDLREFSFIKPFQTIKFEKGPMQNNLQKLTDETLHLDLLPYSAPDFSAEDFIKNYTSCKPFVERLFNGIFAYPRLYVIFTGKFFKILQEYITYTDRFLFEVKSSKGGLKQQVLFTRVTIEYQNKKLIAGIADSYFDETMDESMLEQYGTESASIINRGIIINNTDWSQNLN